LVRDLHLRLGCGKIDWNHFCACYQQYFTDCSVLIETNEPDDQRASLEYIQKKMDF